MSLVSVTPLGRVPALRLLQIPLLAFGQRARAGPGAGGELQVRQMQADERPGIGQRHERRDTRTEIASACPVANAEFLLESSRPGRRGATHGRMGGPCATRGSRGPAIAKIISNFGSPFGSLTIISSYARQWAQLGSNQ
jgi:hypothetical protein